MSDPTSRAFAPGTLHRRAPAAASALVALHAIVKRVLDARLPVAVTVRVAEERLEVGRRLAWTLLSFRRAVSPDAMLGSLPGQRGWNTWLDQLGKSHDATADAAAIRESLARLDEALSEGGLDRGSIAKPRPGDARRRRLEWERHARDSHAAQRRLWPVAGRSKILAWAVSAHRGEPDMADAVSVLLYDEIERTIPGETLFIAEPVWSDAELARHLSAGADPSTLFGRRGPLPPLLVEHSSPDVVGRELHPIENPLGGMAVGFSERDPARRGPLCLAFGQHLPRIGPLAGGEGDVVTWSLDITAPVEFAVLDLLWPRDLPSGGPWEARLVTGGTEAGSPPEGLIHRVSPQAPFEAGDVPTLDLPGPLMSVLPQYRAALEAAVGELGRRLEDFEIWRVQARYPLARTAFVAQRPLAHGEAPSRGEAVLP